MHLLDPCRGSLLLASLVSSLASSSALAARTSPAPAPAPTSEPSLAPIEPHDTCKKQRLDARFRITLEREARLVDLVRWMSSVTCTKFIWSPGVRDGKVTVVSPEPVTIHQAYAAFYAALDTMGLTVEQSGDYLKIVESKDAARHVIPIYRPGEEPPARDRYVTQLYRPQPGRVDDVVAVIEHLKGERGTVSAVGELVIITDTGSAIARLMEVIEQVDAPPGERDAIFLLPLQHADPEEIARIVREVFMSTAGTTAPRTAPARTKAKAPAAAPSPTAAASGRVEDARVAAISVDPRTRTLVITALRSDFPVVRRFVERLDVAAPEQGGTLFVLPLRHADPEDVAQVLSNLPTGATARGSAKPDGGAAPSTAGGVSIGGEIHITADPATRSLVVMASPNDFLALRRVVEALDVERRLVYIEAYILEVSTSHDLGTDVSAHMGRNIGDSLGYASSKPGDLNSAVLDTSVLSGLAAGVLGPGIVGSSELLGTDVDIPAFGVVIQALELNDDVNIVSDPHLYTSDNKTARMEVGKRIPVPTGTNTFANGSVQGTQTNYSREDVSLKLEVTPHVGEGGTLTLDIIIENQEVLPGGGEGGPTTTKRRLELEEVIARDGQPVVLGGLVQEKEQITKRQVPGLGSIPLLGWLFKKRAHHREKVNLLVVLVPHVLESPDDSRRIHERRLAERRELIERESAFDHHDLETHVNYQRKSGLLAAIDAEASRMDTEARFHAQAQHELSRTVAHEIAPDGAYEVTAPVADPSAATVVAGP